MLSDLLYRANNKQDNCLYDRIVIHLISGYKKKYQPLG